jgi:hypothetical protein
VNLLTHDPTPRDYARTPLGYQPPRARERWWLRYLPSWWPPVVHGHSSSGCGGYTAEEAAALRAQEWRHLRKRLPGRSRKKPRSMSAKAAKAYGYGE